MKGSAAAWLIGLIIIFVAIFVWIIFSYVNTVILFPFANTMLANHSNASQTLDIIENAWNYWPVLLIFGVIMAMFIAVLKKEPDTAWVGGYR